MKRQIQKIILSLLVTSACVTTSCKKECPEIPDPVIKECPPDDQEVFEYSFKVGKIALYDVYANFGNGLQNYEEAFKIEIFEEMGGGVFIASATMPMISMADTVVFYQDETGVYEKLDNGNMKTLLRSFYNIGDVYTHTNTDGKTVERQIIDTNSVTVPAGLFSCVQIRESVVGSTTFTDEYISTVYGGLVQLDIVDQFEMSMYLRKTIE